MFQSSSRGVARFILYLPRPPYTPLSLFNTITESIVLQDSLLYSHLTYLSEDIILNLDSSNSSVITSNSIIDIIRGVDSIYAGLRGGITESIVLSSTLSSIQSKVIELEETIKLTHSLQEKVVYLTLLTETLRVLDLIDHGKLESLTDQIILQDSINSLGRLVNVLLESIGITSTVTPNTINLISLSDTFSINSTSLAKGIMKESVDESFILSIPTASGQDTYLAYLLSPETMSVSNYNNYNFDGCTKFKDKYLFFNSTGLYEYGGKRDNNSVYSAYVETIAFNFGSSNLKQVPSIYLGHTSSGYIYLKVKTDGRKESHYKLNKRTENLNTQKIDIGKGLISRYFQFELVTDADDFSVESIDFYPVELRRKI